MSALCMGRIEESLIVPFPQMPEGERETVSAVLESIDDLLEGHAEDFRTWDRAGELPADFIDELKEFGVFGLVIPEEHGGLGFGPTAYSRTLQQLGRHDASVAVTIGAHSSIGMRGLLLFGTDEQKARWMPTLATGEQIAAFCLTEPGAGSDAAGLRTTAVRDGDEWVINGNKLWITNGGIADFFTVFAKTGEPGERRNISAFVVTRDTPGVSVGPHEDKMGLRASHTNAVYFDDVRVPADHLLGEEGKGFKVAMQILNSGRTGLGGGCVGGMKRLIEMATAHANGREQFGRPIADFGMMKQKIGQMVVDAYAAESVVNVVNGLIESGNHEYAVEAAISKIFATEALWRTADEALQVSGGNGYMCEYPYERILRDARINRIFEGTNEVLRLFVALTAMNDVGTQLTELASSVRGIFDDPIKGFGLMSDYARKRVTLASGVRGPTFTTLHADLRPQATQFEGGVRTLARAVDRILRKHGKHIIGKQFASKRLADIMIDLFVLASVLSRVSHAIEAGEGDVAQQVHILDVFCGQAIARVEQNAARIDDNDDETLKAVADHALQLGRYAWDNV
ncbi:MAG: acyl-CoA dehydrogenase family protein [Myxococcales bacterium]|nr:acyl-CoA dehydrogenase family protein [Myxococcales bacterium]